MSHIDWIETGYVDALSGDHQVILVDGRGHGKSDKPHDPNEYLTHHLSSDHVAVLDDLGIDAAHFIGYSMGGATCFGVALKYLERCLSLTLLGFQPYKSENLSHIKLDREPRPVEGLPDSPTPIMDMLENWAEAWIDFWVSNVETSHEMKQRIKVIDFQALISYRLIPDEWKDGINVSLLDIETPCIFLAGEKDTVVVGAKEAAKIMPNCTFKILSEMNHFDTFYRSEQVLPLIKNFLS